jgi:hypothetical protein
MNIIIVPAALPSAEGQIKFPIYCVHIKRGQKALVGGRGGLVQGLIMPDWQKYCQEELLYLEMLKFKPDMMQVLFLYTASARSRSLGTKKKIVLNI